MDSGYMKDNRIVDESWSSYWTRQSLLFCGVAQISPTKIDLTFKWPLLSTAIATSAFSIAGKTISSVVVRECTVSIIVSAAFAYGDTGTVVYTKPAANPLTTVNGYEIASFSKAITNNLVGGGDVGVELITGGNFSDAGNWTQSADHRVTIAGGTANYVATGYGAVSQNLTVTAGKRYLLTYTMLNGGASPLVAFYDGPGVNNIFSQYTNQLARPNGTYSEVVNCIFTSNTFGIWGKAGGGNWSMDNISLKEIVPYVATTWAVKRIGDTDDDALFAIKRLSNNHYLAGSGYTTGHLYRSTDGGETWVNEGELLAGETDIYDFIDRGNGLVYASTAQHGNLFKSTNYGLNGWTTLGQIEGMKYMTLYADMGNGIIVAATENSYWPPNKAVIIRSTDGGETWSTVFTPVDGVTLMNMLQDCGNGVIICGMGGYAADPHDFTMLGHVARSTDYGATWTDLGQLSIAENRFFGSCNLGNGIILIGSDATGAKIYRSVNYGANWTLVNSGVTGQTWVAGFLNLGYGRVIAMTKSSNTATGGILMKSDDYGATWIQEGIIQAGHYFQYRGIVHDPNTVIISSATNGSIPAVIAKNSNGLFSRS
jgi:photosystem II stability/assembly factor-like uncharacterized protein